jgi:hypothetical protein
MYALKARIGWALVAWLMCVTIVSEPSVFDAPRPQVYAESELKLGNRLKIRPSRPSHYFRESGEVDAYQLTGLAQGAVADRKTNVLREPAGHLVHGIYRRHVRPIRHPLPGVRSIRPRHTTSVDDRSEANS